jgi:hypothetical protein
MSPQDQLDRPVPFGVYGHTGCSLAGLDRGAFEAFREREKQAKNSQQNKNLEQKARKSVPHFGTNTKAVDDPNDLSRAGWAVLYSPSANKDIRRKLEPLLKVRREQAGGLYKEFEVPGGQDAYAWLHAFGLVQDQLVTPAKGVPYYLLIVAPPDEISFEFQYTVDIQWAVGRIWFPVAEDFARYAKSVVDYESSEIIPTSRQVAVFATEHKLDRATQLFTKCVAKPLVDPADPIGASRKYAVQSFLGENATRDNLHRIWSGSIDKGPPALVFTGTHGMAFPSGDAEQAPSQGAILCQDWEGFGKIRREDYYAAANLPASAKVWGMIHFFFACYAAGWPQLDNFSRLANSHAEIAPKPMLARLPQALLAHQSGGALAVIGHVDRAWAYSFRSDDKVTYIDGFEDATTRILRGERVGNAMDAFNQRWSILSSSLAELERQVSRREDTDVDFESALATRLSNQWVARDDARNYIVFGDPAVRLREKDMPGL